MPAKYTSTGNRQYSTTAMAMDECSSTHVARRVAYESWWEGESIHDSNGIKEIVGVRIPTAAGDDAGHAARRPRVLDPLMDCRQCLIEVTDILERRRLHQPLLLLGFLLQVPDLKAGLAGQPDPI
jgi:hypothetical protein